MFADKALRCDCGYEVRADDEAACVDAVTRHASEAHGIDLPVELALDLVRRAGTRAERRTQPERRNEGGEAMSILRQALASRKEEP
jgi:predicted small metal-binding protein